MDTIVEERDSERWYIAVTARGFPTEVVNQIFERIPRFGLEDFITRVSHERGILKRGEFYLFLGVASPSKGHIPSDILNRFQTFLSNLRLRDQGVHLSYDEFKQMASKEIEGRNFRHIRMVKSKPQETNDPFTSIADSEPPMVVDSDKYEHLLRWLSAVGSGSWNLYKDTCQALGLAEDGREGGRIMRRLDVLGHVERYEQRRKWIATSACFVDLEQSPGSVTYFLVGKRSGAMIESLEQNMGIVERSAIIGAPDRVTVTFPSESTAQEAARNLSLQGKGQIQFAGNAALNLATVLPPVDRWYTMLDSLPPLDRSSYGYKQWDQQAHDFVSLTGIPRETGLYQLERITNASYKPEFPAFYDAAKDRWFRGDWYGLRFLALTDSESFIPKAQYESTRRQLAIHLDYRWPDLYERALVLASGLLPAMHEHNWLIFENISENLAYLLSDKLGVELVQNPTG